MLNDLSFQRPDNGPTVAPTVTPTVATPKHPKISSQVPCRLSGSSTALRREHIEMKARGSDPSQAIYQTGPDAKPDTSMYSKSGPAKRVPLCTPCKQELRIWSSKACATARENR